jgi:regulation of enolase protein 1 (concanavalin A-like superfamily)
MVIPDNDDEVIVHNLSDPTLQWFHEPTDDGNWQRTTQIERGDDHPHKLILVPPSRKDYWRRTYYEPLLIKDDGPFLYKSLQYPVQEAEASSDEAKKKKMDSYFTVETTFDLVASAQFDQAGIMIRGDHKHWIKTGIEVVDRKPRLSCVVTNNDYSDWSTQMYHQGIISESDDQDETSPVQVEKVQIRVHCRGKSFVVEAKVDDEWQFIRIAHMELPSDQLWVGIFACCPIAQSGGKATFSSFSVRRGSSFDHHA